MPTKARSVAVLRHDWDGQTLITVHNVAATSRRVRLQLERDLDGQLRDLLHAAKPVPLRRGAASLTLAPYDHRWLRIDVTP